MDKYEVILYPKAFRDIEDIYAYIAFEKQSLSNAKAQTDRIWAAIKKLEIFPEAHQNRIVGRYAGKGYKQLIIDSTFPCSSEQSFLGLLHGGNDRQIAKQIAESGVHAPAL